MWMFQRQKAVEVFVDVVHNEACARHCKEQRQPIGKRRVRTPIADLSEQVPPLLGSTNRAWQGCARPCLDVDH